MDGENADEASIFSTSWRTKIASFMINVGEIFLSVVDGERCLVDGTIIIDKDGMAHFFSFPILGSS